MFHIPFLMVFYHVRTIIVPIGICVSAFICAGVYNLINRVIAHSRVCLHMYVCMFAYTLRSHAARMWVLILPVSVPGLLWGFCSVYEPGILTQFVALALCLSLFLSLSLCPPAGAYCEPAWLERRAHSDWTKRHTHHWAALPTSPPLITLAGCCRCVCAHVCVQSVPRLTRRSNKSTCLSTASSLPFALTYSPITPPSSSLPTHLFCPLLPPSLSFMSCNSSF